MGASSSAEILRQPLVAPPQPVAAVHSCFCHVLPTTLHVREQPPTFSSDAFVIRDAVSGLVLFRVDTTALSLHDRKVLQDAQGETIVHLQEKLLSFRRTLVVSADYEAQKRHFEIQTQVTLLDAELECSFRDVMSGATCRVGVVGNWRRRAAVIWLDTGDGRKVPVARAYIPPPEVRTSILDKHDYYVDIAPNVDTALVTLVCLALDASKNK